MHREGQGQLPTMTHWEEVRGPAGPGVPPRGEVFHPRVGIGVVNKKILIFFGSMNVLLKQCQVDYEPLALDLAPMQVQRT